MDMILPLDISCQRILAWRPNNNSNQNNLRKTTVFRIPFETPTPPLIQRSFTNHPSASPRLKMKFQHHPSSHSRTEPQNTSFKDTAVLLETSHQFGRLKRAWMEKLKDKGSNPLQVLKDGGDCSTEHFWDVIRFLKQTSRSKEILQVFDLWKNKEKSRINEFNYEKIIGLLVEEGLLEEAVVALGETKSHGLRPSLEIYNQVIHGFAIKGRFEDALFYLKGMEDIDLKADTETYDGLIQAYGNCRMYDEMDQCMKKMESKGCLPDHVTYNLLIREFSQAGLLNKMESTYRTLLSKRMDLQSSTLIAMLEAYANFGILDKMEKVYKRVLNSKTPLKEDVIRKLAGVYIQNHMFSRLDDLGHDLSSKIGRTDLVWCLCFLSHACLLSQKGMEFIVQEMRSERVPWNVTVANIILLAHLKMKDFTHLKFLFSELPAQYVKPDIVTVGILFDAYRFGFEGPWVLHTWRRMGFLDAAVEMNTDALVVTAFGKGHFLRSCEEMYSALDLKARTKEVWTYQHLIDLVYKHNKQLPQLMGPEQLKPSM